jgi:2-haloacid dehalogenase/putative hydrolase of the HAD superfamily
MSRAYDVITFDCYGTLIDWEDGIVSAFTREAAADGIALDPSRIIGAYHEVEPAVEAEQYEPYRDVLARTARRVADRLDWDLSEARSRFLPDSLADWTPFPDTNPALVDLVAAGYRLGILSNVDDDLLEKTRTHFPVDFEIIVTAAQVRSYKPAPGHFLEARRRIGSARWLHAAQSWFHDVVPAHGMEIPVAWVNRKNELRSPDAEPDAEVTNLTGLADWLESGD